MATYKNWTRTLDPDSEKFVPGLWTQTLKNLDPEKHRSWKTCNKYKFKKCLILESYVL